MHATYKYCPKALLNIRKRKEITAVSMLQNIDNPKLLVYLDAPKIIELLAKLISHNWDKLMV